MDSKKKNAQLWKIPLALFIMVSFKANGQLGTTEMDISADDASNYSSFSGNEGSGFGAWIITSAGTSSAYIGTTGQGATSFGLSSNASFSNYIYARRDFESSLKEGEYFTVDVGHTSIATGGIVGIEILSGGNPVWEMTYVGGETYWKYWTSSGFGGFRGYTNTDQEDTNNTSLTFKFTYKGSNNYDFQIGSASGTNLTAVNSIGSVDGVRFYSAGQGGGATTNNFGFNNLRVVSKHTIPSGTTLVASSDVTVPFLEIRSGGTLNVNEGIEIDCEGDLILNGSSTLNASASGYSQLKVDGTVSGSGSLTAEQYVGSTGWHCMSMPVTGNLNQFGSVNSAVHANTRNIYKWDESSTSWVDIVGATTGSGTANAAGFGYLVYVGTNGVISSAGNIDLTGGLFGSTSPSLTNAGSGTDAGWNLIGNPFPCGINFFGLSTSDVEAGYSIWNPSTGSYKAYAPIADASARIPPMQAFWVKANGSSPSLGSISMSAHCDVLNVSTFLKTSNTPADRIYLQSFEQADPSHRDELLIALVPGTQDGLDAQWDVSKRLNASTVPSLMSAANGDELAINAIDHGPLSAKPKLLQLRFVSAKNNEDCIVLEDKKLSKRHDLNSRAYRFTHDVTEEYRFVLHLEPLVERLDEHTQVVVAAGSGSGRFFIIYFKDGSSAEPMEGALYDLQGRKVQSFTVPAGQDRVEVSTQDLPAGIYLLKIQTPNGLHAEKILIE
jgi:hypothetical protein